MSLSDIASFATAAGVVLVVVQLWYSRQQARTALEDALSKEYREIALALPVEMFFDANAEAEVPAFSEHLRDFLRYIDLTNQQVFLRSQRRVSRRTWRLWRDGIRDNLTQRPAFRDAWGHLNSRMYRSFDELKELTLAWETDPAWWDPPTWRRPFKRLRAELPDRSRDSDERRP